MQAGQTKIHARRAVARNTWMASQRIGQEFSTLGVFLWYVERFGMDDTLVDRDELENKHPGVG